MTWYKVIVTMLNIVFFRMATCGFLAFTIMIKFTLLLLASKILFLPYRFVEYFIIKRMFRQKWLGKDSLALRFSAIKRIKRRQNKQWLGSNNIKSGDKNSHFIKFVQPILLIPFLYLYFQSLVINSRTSSPMWA